MNQILEPRELRTAFSRFATGVTVVTYEFEGEPRGVTVNSFTSVSLDPALALVSIGKQAATAERMAAGPFAINVLSEEQQAHALQFSGRQQAGLDIEWNRGPGLAPWLAGTVAVYQCAAWQIIDAGDHNLHIGEVKSVQTSSERNPLLFLDGRFLSAGQNMLAAV
ncbi:flavin reductase family protein [Arthrobacter sp. NPDC089319]|uniref:flavin reductase family protein n=1 Tax=Arthrobacter sp. NPDC089319 TaxID=3155915 RepID=UPI00342E51D6